jgi:hypothetical protein
MPDDPLRILYCDDQENFRTEFLARHGDRFAVEAIDHITNVLPTLLNRRPEELPDLLLLDLYHDIDPANDDDDSDRIGEAKAALKELDGSIQRAKHRVDLAWRPVAVEVAEEIRHHFPMHALPIMIYSQKGLLFLDDEQMRRFESAEVDWLLKDSDRFSAATEYVRIRRVVERSRASKQIPRDVRIAIWSVAAGLAGSALTLAIQAIFT